GMRAGTETALARVVAVFGAAKPHHAYLFANRRANRMKVLVHDGIGVWLAARRLNRGKFVCTVRSWEPATVHPLWESDPPIASISTLRRARRSSSHSGPSTTSIMATLAYPIANIHGCLQVAASA